MDLSIILACMLLWGQSSALFYACRDVWFGKPSEEDAFAALRSFPDHDIRPATLRRTQSHLFVQPQYLDPPFSPVKNKYSQGIVQLPKIWRAGKARYALVPLKQAYEEKIEAITDADWLQVETCALRLSVSCVKSEARSGFCIIQDIKPSSVGAMVLYLYASGSAFELRLLEEMLNGGGIRPKEFSNGFDEGYRAFNDTLETLEEMRRR